MYEQGNPHILYEPEGDVDMTAADFEQVDEQTVRVSGSRFIPTPRLRIKLEGAASRASAHSPSPASATAR
jgi:hypothetical protein